MRRSISPLGRLCPFVLVFVVAIIGFVALVTTARVDLRNGTDELSVALPVSMQLLLAAGDNYLAANLGGFRAALVGVHQLQPETYQALASVQRDVSLLNPYHEDNYYLAAAILPWNGQVETTQFILKRAIEVRLNDDMPPFFWAFHQLYFLADSLSAARMLEAAAERSMHNRDMLTNLASIWYSKGSDPGLAIGVTRQLADRTKNPGLRSHLLQRAARLEMRLNLQRAVELFKERQGRLPKALSEIVTAGIVKELPMDPWGAGFALTRAGIVELNQKVSP